MNSDNQDFLDKTRYDIIRNDISTISIWQK